MITRAYTHRYKNNPLIDLQREVYRESRSGQPVEQLLPWIVDPRNLEAAWQRVSAADGANTPGNDGLTADHVERNLDRWLNKIEGRLKDGSYEPAPPRWVDVPKESGGTRRLGILTLGDRLVHASIKQVFEPIMEPAFSDASFGFRPGRSVPAALEVATRKLTGSPEQSAPFRYLCKLDVANCFDTIDHAILTRRLREVVGDEDVLRLLGRLICAGGTRTGWWRRRTIGLVQGSGLSPLLCNFSLDPLDQQLAALGRRSSGAVYLLRYADDLLLLARDRGWARRGMRLVRAVLAGLRQRLKRSKTKIAPAHEPVRWLGVEIRGRRDPWSGRDQFSYFVPDEKVCQMLERVREMTAPPSTRIDPTTFDLGRWLVSINTQLRDWWQAYQYAENSSAVFRKLDQHTFHCVRDLLSAVTGLRRGKLGSEHLVRLPRGFQTWQVSSARMVVLSALAPRCPSQLSRRPLWMISSGRRH